MKRSNSKEVTEFMKNHVLSYYTIEELKEEVKAAKDRITLTNYAAGVRLVEGGCFVIWISDARETLKAALSETDEEANRYDNEKVWNLYKHLTARAIEKLLK